MGELAKIDSFRRDLAVAETYEEIKLCESKAAAVAEFAKKQKISKDKQDDLGVFRVEIEAKKGAWLEEFYPHGGDRKSSCDDSNLISMTDEGIGPHESSDARLVFNKVDAVQEAIDEIKQDQKQVVTPAAVVKLIKKKKKADKKQADKTELLEAQESVKSEIESFYDLRVCSCKELFESGIKPDAVITDPPYPKEFISVFTEIAKSCKGVPLVAVMSGQSYLPEVMQRLCEHLKYRWTLAYLTPGGQAVQQWPVKVNTFWKPVILFGESNEWFGDVAASRANDNDKRFHKWGQSESGMMDLVERLTKPGQLVCDPFLGGGAVAVASLAAGRRFVGCDIDKNCIEKTEERINNLYA